MVAAATAAWTAAVAYSAIFDEALNEYLFLEGRGRAGHRSKPNDFWPFFGLSG